MSAHSGTLLSPGSSAMYTRKLAELEGVLAAAEAAAERRSPRGRSPTAPAKRGVAERAPFRDSGLDDSFARAESEAYLGAQSQRQSDSFALAEREAYGDQIPRHGLPEGARGMWMYPAPEPEPEVGIHHAPATGAFAFAAPRTGSTELAQRVTKPALRQGMEAMERAHFALELHGSPTRPEVLEREQSAWPGPARATTSHRHTGTEEEEEPAVLRPFHNVGTGSGARGGDTTNSEPRGASTEVTALAAQLESLRREHRRTVVGYAVAAAASAAVQLVREHEVAESAAKSKRSAIHFYQRRTAAVLRGWRAALTTACWRRRRLGEAARAQYRRRGRRVLGRWRRAMERQLRWRQATEHYLATRLRTCLQVSLRVALACWHIAHIARIGTSRGWLRRVSGGM
jgi:hypothetical protein